MQYKILVVDDSAFMRKMIKDMVEADESFEVPATAKNGKEAIEAVKRLKPDAVTMDVEMPEMNGLDALKKIMAEHPLPVVMISSLTQEGAKETILALEYGAFDFVPKPSGSISLDIGKVKEELHTKLRLAVQSRRPKTIAVTSSVKERTKIAPINKRKAKTGSQKAEIHARSFHDIVAIGTSTGGPRALNQVISQIPERFPAPIVIVQHMPPKFTQSLAMRLNTISAIHVVEAENGQPLQPGVAYIAPGGKHMTVERSKSGFYRIAINEQEPFGGHRPSVDVLFRSLLPMRDLRRHIVLMTGMGKDGAEGMKQLKEAGAETTIAEDSKTCVVYGMPKAAVELGAADDIVPLENIAARLVKAVMP